MTKQIYDRLVAAEWIDNVRDVESHEQKGGREQAITWMKGKNPQEDGGLKLIVFSQLYRELLKGGIISMDEINLIVSFGRGIAIQKGLEKL